MTWCKKSNVTTATKTLFTRSSIGSGYKWRQSVFRILTITLAFSEQYSWHFAANAIILGMSAELGTEVKHTSEKQSVLQTWNKLSAFKIQNIDLHELILQRSMDSWIRQNNWKAEWKPGSPILTGKTREVSIFMNCKLKVFFFKWPSHFN